MYKSMDYKAKVKEVNTHEKRGRLLSLETLLHKKYTKQFTQWSVNENSIRKYYAHKTYLWNIYEPSSDWLLLLNKCQFSSFWMPEIKGQLNSEINFGVFKSPIKRTNFWRISAQASKMGQTNKIMVLYCTN